MHSYCFSIINSCLALLQHHVFQFDDYKSIFTQNIHENEEKYLRMQINLVQERVEIDFDGAKIYSS